MRLMSNLLIESEVMCAESVSIRSIFSYTLDKINRINAYFNEFLRINKKQLCKTSFDLWIIIFMQMMHC